MSKMVATRVQYVVRRKKIVEGEQISNCTIMYYEDAFGGALSC
jgi:hypothetical protein